LFSSEPKSVLIGNQEKGKQSMSIYDEESITPHPRMSAGSFGSIPLVTRQKYTLRSTGGGAGALSEVIIARYVPTALWVSGAVEVLLHYISAADGTFTVRVYNTYRSPDEPNTDFVVETSPIGVVSIAGGGAGPAPYYINPLTAPIGSMLRVALRYTEDAGAGDRIITLSVNLIGRPA
jgi:hypothetical protein